ncbi:hypothetical protein DXG01_013575 [Tephrocybe rancida]|nr:hypothetical protein DXG01_013575 [Tephrocybe rancida]
MGGAVLRPTPDFLCMRNRIRLAIQHLSFPQRDSHIQSLKHPLFHKKRSPGTLLPLSPSSHSYLHSRSAPSPPRPTPSSLGTSAPSPAAPTGTVGLDTNWRWTHSTSGSTNCYTGTRTLCSNGATCTTNYALDGADYSGVYGVTTSGDALTLKFVTKGANTNVGSRLCLFHSESKYEFKPTLSAGTDLPLIPTPVLATTVPAVTRWTSGRPTRSPLPTLPISALSPASAAALAPSAIPMVATSTQGDKTSYSPDLNVGITKKLNVVTQFISSDGTANGDLTEIHRLYVQNGAVIQNSKTIIPGLDSYDSITGAYCDTQKTTFNDTAVSGQGWPGCQERHGPCPLRLGQSRSQHALALFHLPH